MDVQLLITIVTASTTLITAIAVALINYRNNKKIENIKSEIESKSKKDNEIFKFLLTYETENINQYLIALKEFLQKSQESKDKIKQLFSNHTLIKEERKQKLEVIREEIIKVYSKNVYYFNLSDKKSIAHSVKNLLIELIDIINKVSTENFSNKLSQISEGQKQLQVEVDKEISSALNLIKIKT
jgi:hypothetical protein